MSGARTKPSHGNFAASSRRARRRLAPAATLAACLAALSGLTASASGSPAAESRATVVLGQTATTPAPACPGLPCQAVGSVTGFQVGTSQSTMPFRVPKEGKVTSWTLTLSKPTGKQRFFFNGFFGMPPEARLAILSGVPGTNPPRYSLRSQSAVHVLTPYLGQTVRFAASLPVQRGDIVALTIPTWAPAFAEGLSSADAWRASRLAGKCNNATDVRQGEPQQRVGNRATYGCRYTTARLLYTATIAEE